MKKLLIATAALAMVAGTVQAQSSVSIYGRLDAGFSDKSTTASATGVEQQGAAFAFNNHSTSRIGFKGAEDLGGGLKANLLIETQLAQTNNLAAASVNGTTVAATSLGNRGLWTGIEGKDLGEFRVGLQNSFTKDYMSAYSSSGGSNVLGDPTLGSGRAALNTSRAGMLDARYTGLTYATPTLSGFKVKAFVVSDKQDTTQVTAATNNQKGQEFAVEYAAGKFNAALTIGSYKTNGATGAGSTTPTAILRADSTIEHTQKQATINATYDFGMAKAFFKNAKVESKESGGSSATDAEANYNVFGVSVPFGKVTVFANYAMGEYETVTGTTKLDDQGSQLGVTYAFSKRTSLYGIYGTTKTDLTSSTNEKDKQYAFGMIHSF